MCRTDPRLARTGLLDDSGGMSDDEPKTGNDFRVLRKRLGLTQEQVARRARVSQAAVSCVERERPEAGAVIIMRIKDVLMAASGENAAPTGSKNVA